MEDIRNFLESNGYRLKDIGEYWTTAANFRGGVKETSLNIRKADGFWRDWVQGISGDFKDLVCLITGEGEISDEKLKELIKRVETYEPPPAKVKVKKTYDKECLVRLLPDFRFYTNRGISEKTIREFSIGLATSGKLRNRLITPIFERPPGKSIIGFFGRWHKEVMPDNVPKTKNLGKKTDWIFPAYINDQIIREKGEVALVEGISDMLALWDIGYKTVLVLFGAEISSKLLAYVCGIMNLNKVIIATNNDKIDNDSGTGNAAADEIKEKLSKFINEDSIEIRLPQTSNDWCAMLKDKRAELKKIWVP